MKTDPLILVLMGAPGAGKGTQAKMLAAHYQLQHLSTGDILRAAVAEGSKLGKQAQSFMNAGKLVPDEIVTGIVLDYLKTHNQTGVLLDGFPRTIAQAEGLTLALKGREVIVVSVDVADEEVVERLSSRRVCVQCGRVYNPALGLQAPGGRCICKGELIQRDDDRPETIARRLMVYHSQTEPVIEYYSQSGKSKRINGDGTPEEVFVRIKDAIG